MNKFSINSSLIFFPLLVGTSLFAQVVLSVINYGDNSAMYWVVNILYMLCLLAVAVGYSLACKHNFVRETSLNKAPRIGSTLVLLVVVTALVFANTVINDYIIALIKSLGGIVNELSPDLFSGNMLLSVLAVCIIAPVVEEVCFRGVLLGGLNSRGSIMSVLACGVLFALFHANMAQTYHQFILGCVLAVFAITTKSLWVAIIGHIYNNILVLVLDRLLYSTGFFSSNPLLIVIVSMLIAVAVLAVYITKNARQFTRYGECEKVAVDRPVVVVFVLAVVALVILWISSGVGI